MNRNPSMESRFTAPDAMRRKSARSFGSVSFQRRPAGPPYDANRRLTRDPLEFVLLAPLSAADPEIARAIALELGRRATRSS